MKHLPLWLFLAALALRLLIAAATHLDGLYGQDAFAYFACARELVNLGAAHLPCTDFYWPLGYPAWAALFMWLTRSDAAFGAQLASMVAGAALAPLAYWLAIETVRAERGTSDAERTGLAAGVLVVFCGMLLVASLVVMSDAAGLFWATLSTCLLLRWARAPGRDAYAGASLSASAAALAVAIATRWIFAGMLLPFCGFLAVTLVREARTAAGGPAAWSPPARARTLLAIALAALIFGVILGAQLFFNAHTPAPVLKHSWVVNWNPLHAWQRSFDTPDGHFDYRWPPAVFYAEPLFHPIYLFPTLTGCVLFGAWQLRRCAALIVLGGWVLALYLYLIGLPYENGRFGLAFFAPVAVLAALGLSRLPVPTWLPMRGSEWRWRWLWLALSLVLAMPFTVRAIARLREVVTQQNSAISYLQSQVPPGTTVVSFELSISLQHYTSFAIVDLFAESPRTLRPVVCSARPAYVYVEPAKLETQWLGKSPAENFHWLRDSIGLQERGMQGSWTLYQVLPCRP